MAKYRISWLGHEIIADETTATCATASLGETVHDMACMMARHQISQVTLAGAHLVNLGLAPMPKPKDPNLGKLVNIDDPSDEVVACIDTVAVHCYITKWRKGPAGLTAEYVEDSDVQWDTQESLRDASGEPMFLTAKGFTVSLPDTKFVPETEET